MRLLRRGSVLVQELHDPEQFYAVPDIIRTGPPLKLYTAETEHSEPCVGRVEVVGSNVRRCIVGDTVIFHPYAGGDAVYLDPGKRLLNELDIIGTIVDGELIPAPNLVVILPDWTDLDRNVGGLIIMPRETQGERPRVKGTCLQVGRHVSLVRAGQTVLIPPGLQGYEVGFRDRVLYLLPEDEILAILEG